MKKVENGMEKDKNGKDRRWQCKHCESRRPEEDDDDSDHFGCTKFGGNELFRLFVTGRLCRRFKGVVQ